MNQSEALREVRYTRRQRAKKRNTLIRSYLFAAGFLFLLVCMLILNNIRVYRVYVSVREQIENNISKIQTSDAVKEDIKNQNSILMTQNEELKIKYETILEQNSEIIRQMEEVKKQNQEFQKKNEELMKDNIALQNSLKAAASVGIKPQNYTRFSGITSRGEIQRGTYLGKFLGTAYTPSKDECGNNKGITNSGKPIIPGVSIAVDDKFWPFGTVFYIRGLGYAVAMDTGSAINGKERFDFAVFDKKFAKTLGSKYWDVYLVKLGDGSVKDVQF